MHENIRPEQRYKVGDSVVIKHDPVVCAFGWVNEMSQYRGEKAVITDAILAHEGRDWRYEIDIDHGFWGWCDNCFEPNLISLPEFDASAVDLAILFSQ